MAPVCAIRILVVAALLSALTCASIALAGETNSRSERCFRLREQLDAAIATKTAIVDRGAIHRLRKKAIHFCTSSKEAQGARAFAKALALYGMKPLEPPLANLSESQAAKEN